MPCEDVALRCTVVVWLFLHPYSWAIDHLLHSPFLLSIFALGFAVQSCTFGGFYIQMSESSDTTHSAILHNIVAFHRRLARQVIQLESDVQNLATKVNEINRKVDLLLDTFAIHDRPAAAVQASTASSRPSTG